MNHMPRVPFRISDAQSDSVNSPVKTIQLEGQRIEDFHRPDGFRQHPQVRRLAPMPSPQQLQQGQTYGHPGHNAADYVPMDAAAYGQPGYGNNVSVNNNQQMFRPWKEELALSFARTVGNFFAWPFRLIGRLFESLLGLLKTMLMIIVAPMLLFSGYSFYQENQHKPATEIAAEMGKAGVGLVGSMIAGVWDGIFGDDEPAKGAPAK